MFPQIPEWVGRLFPTYYMLQPVVSLSLGRGGWSDIAVSLFVLIGLDVMLAFLALLAAGRMMRR